MSWMRGLRSLLQKWRGQLAWQSDEVLREQVALVWGNLPVALVASAVTALGQVWFMWDRVAPAICLAWLAWHWGQTLLSFGLQRWAQKNAPLRQQARIQVLCLGLLGLGWGSSITVASAFGSNALR
jgi:hypothetical protein